MIKFFNKRTHVWEVEGFNGRAITTDMESRYLFDVEVYVNGVLNEEYSPYLIDGKIRIVFYENQQGDVVVKRKAKMDKIAVFGFLQGPAFWERFYDGLVQCLQDEGRVRLEQEAKQVGYFANRDFVVTVSNFATVQLSKLYQAIRNFPLLNNNRIWRAFTSFRWFRNILRDEGHSCPPRRFTQDLSILEDNPNISTYPLLEVYENKPFTQNKMTGLSDLGNGKFTFVKEFTTNRIILYRQLYNPFQRAQVWATLGSDSRNATFVYGPFEYHCEVDHTVEQLVLTVDSQNGIVLTSLPNASDTDTLMLEIEGVQIPLIITLKKKDEGIVSE